MRFSNQNLPERLAQDLTHFLSKNDFVELYKSYSWRNDTFQNGFPDILKLEAQLTESDRNEGISLDDVRDVASWGKLRNFGRIAGNDTVLPPNTLHSNTEFNPIGPVVSLEKNIAKGIGPTYLSKVLRFGKPLEYGAIDTRCVRVFGNGDNLAKRHEWIKLRVRNDGYGWYIPKAQAAWPSEYGTWIAILRFFSHILSSSCPHPQKFVSLGLRTENKWTCADVEMALFTYASQFT